MKRRSRFAPRTTFQKMTLAFLLLGVLPLLLLGLIYFARYRTSVEEVMWDNYAQINRYFAEHVEDVFASVDAALGSLYDYSDGDRQTLTEALRPEFASEGQKTMLVMNALEYSMRNSPYISSERLVDQDGRIYSLYADQTKVLREDAGMFTELRNERMGDLRDELVLGTMPEETLCIQSEDYIFSVVRNYMDTSRIELARDHVLGTVYADVNVLEIDSICDEMKVSDGQFFIYSPEGADYLYGPEEGLYRKESDPLSVYQAELTDTSGILHKQGNTLFYRRLSGTDQYAVLLINDRQILGNYFQGKTVMVLILCFICFALFVLYLWFSVHLAAPARRLKEGMEEIRQGNLDARVDIRTSDEMEYIADGFNRMVEDLQTYINQVYVAEIMTRDAELNALKMQIQPHYLYNTLDVIRMTALGHQDKETAQLLESLAFQLRYVMGSHKDQVPLREELRMLEEYFVIMRARYENRITLHIEVEREELSLKIPKLILQPIVENAVRHGLRQKKDEGIVEVRAQRQNGDLLITVMDNGVGIEPARLRELMELIRDTDISAGVAEGKVSVGLKNVYDRIRINCGEEYGYRMESVPGSGTIVTIRLPVVEDTDELESSIGG